MGFSEKPRSVSNRVEWSLGNHSRHNRLFLAAQEVGRAVFQLEWISSLPPRQHVTGTTNKDRIIRRLPQMAVVWRGCDRRERSGRTSTILALSTAFLHNHRSGHQIVCSADVSAVES
jgi:hypothetical protein